MAVLIHIALKGFQECGEEADLFLLCQRRLRIHRSVLRVGLVGLLWTPVFVHFREGFVLKPETRKRPLEAAAFW